MQKDVENDRERRGRSTIDYGLPHRDEGGDVVSRLRAGLFPSLLALVALPWAQSRPASAASGEFEHIAALLGLRPGAVVADVGAGDGRYAVELARAVRSAGRVIATEIARDKLETIASRAAAEGLANVETTLGDQQRTGLAVGCCDAILLRLVYHHFADPARMRASLREALRPDGLLLVVDTLPQRHWRQLDGVPERGGHGIEPGELIAELTADGFALVSRHDDWPGAEPAYAVLFRRLP
jgi:SAM-dependent methyltransferase